MSLTDQYIEPLPRQKRWPWWGIGLLTVTGLAVLAWWWAVDSSPATARLLVLLAVVAVAVTVLAAGLVYSRRSPSPYLGRAADIADVLAIMALIPLACAVIGIFGAIKDLFGSIGG